VTINRLKKELCSGGNIGILIFLFWGSLVLAGLLLTVHSRDAEEAQSALQGRWPDVILLWEKQGYFVRDDLWFSKPLTEDHNQSIVPRYHMGFLQVAHLLERIHIGIEGSFSVGLLAFHNQFIPMLTSTFLGFLAMRSTLSLGIRPVHAFTLGLSAQTIYQTLPNNLWFYWEIYPTTLFTFFMAFLLVCRSSIEAEKTKRKSLPVLQKVIIFCMVYVEWIGSLLFLSAYCYISRYFSPANTTIKVEFEKFISPIFLALILMAGQVIWVQVSPLNTQPQKKDSRIHTELNHSFLQDKDVATILEKRYEPLLPSWNFLATIGFLATFIVMALAWKEKNLSHIIVLTTGISFYALFLLFDPDPFILPEAYEIYLAFTLILALFALLPGWLETFNENSGIFVLVSLVFSICWSCFQLRNYALYYPLVIAN
jgi:hypothetical protein